MTVTAAFLFTLFSSIAIRCYGQLGEAIAANKKGATWSSIWDAVDDAKAARALAVKCYPKSLHNGKGDALRHCYWNCLMVLSIGAGQAKIIADNHEDYTVGPCEETVMDKHNNAVGRRYGAMPGATAAICATKCKAGIGNGDLQNAPKKEDCDDNSKGKCPGYYKYIRDGSDRTYEKAKKYCEDTYGSSLATIQNEEQLDCALDIIGGDDFPWIGLRSDSIGIVGDSNKRVHIFEYIDGEPCPSEGNGIYPGACLGPEFWLEERPKKCTEGGSKCVRLFPNEGKINNDVECTDALTSFLCGRQDAIAN